MAKEPTVKIRIDVPDEKWDLLVKYTGETEPRKVVEAAMKAYLAYQEADRGRADA